MANEGKSGEPHELAYTNCKVIGNGSFGVVFQAKLVSNSEDAAIKKVLQDKRFKVYTLYTASLHFYRRSRQTCAEGRGIFFHADESNTLRALFAWLYFARTASFKS